MKLTCDSHFLLKFSNLLPTFIDKDNDEDDDDGSDGDGDDALKCH